MTATDVLRRLLDECGVEWWQKKRHTCWKVSKGQEVEMWRAWEAPDGSLTLKVDYIYNLTPEQAIAATLGDAGATGERQADAGTCHNNGYVYFSERYFVCSSCGCEFDYSDFACEFAEGRSLGSPHYCPNCGARVVEPTTNDVDGEVDE